MFPLSSWAEWGPTTDLALALLLGLGFGACLARAGFGSARKLTAVFYFYDMAVVKVMFTAIVTTLVGLAVMSAAGWLDLGELYLEPTNIAAQGLGGLIFGAGFIVGGYCPGTSIAAMASGRKDAFAFAGGMLAGVTAFAEFTPDLETWIREGSRGELTLPMLTGLGMGVWAAIFVAALVLAGWGMSALELRFHHLRPRS